MHHEKTMGVWGGEQNPKPVSLISSTNITAQYEKYDANTLIVHQNVTKIPNTDLTTENIRENFIQVHYQVLRSDPTAAKNTS